MGLVCRGASPWTAVAPVALRIILRFVGAGTSMETKDQTKEGNMTKGTTVAETQEISENIWATGVGIVASALPA